MTKRAWEHAGLVLALKAYKRCYRANGPGVSGPRWRAIGRVQAEPVLYRTELNLPQGKTKPLRLLQFTTAPFEPVWATKEKHNDN